MSVRIGIHSQFHNLMYHGGVGPGSGLAGGGLVGLVWIGGVFVFVFDGCALATTCFGGAFDLTRAGCGTG